MATLHYAPTVTDAEQTACNMSVGYVLAELEEDVTENTSTLKGDRDACKDCLESLGMEPKDGS